MASSKLWIHVLSASIKDNDTAPVYVYLRVGGVTEKTHKLSPPEPQWDYDFTIEIQNNVFGSVILELYRTKLFLLSDLVGMVTLPLADVRHSNKKGEGVWHNLVLPKGDGGKEPTEHKLRADLRFELPADIPEDIAEALEKKMRALDCVLQEEVAIIQQQKYKIKSGELAPPTNLAHVPSSPYPSRSPSVLSFNSRHESYDSMHESSSYSVSPSPEPLLQNITPSIVHQLSSAGSLDSLIELHVPGDIDYTNTQDSRYRTETFSSEDLNFPGFEWERDDSRRYRSASPSRYDSPPTSRRGSRGGSPLLFSQSVDVPRRSSLKSNQLQPPSLMDDTRLSPLLASKNSLNQPEAGGLSAQGSVVSLVSETGSSSGKMMWKMAYEKQLPEIRRKMNMSKSFAGMKGNGAITLAQLVDQLHGYKQLTQGRGGLSDSVNYFSTVNAEFRSRSRSVIDLKKLRQNKKHYIDEDVRTQVYKRTLEALIYPASEPDNHKFEIWSARKPTNCSECSSLLWGLANQGVKCARCGKICHERCSTIASQDCFIHDQESAINDKMQRMEVNHEKRFELLREAFNIPKHEHEAVIRETKDKILTMAKNFKAEVIVRVIGCQGVQLRDSDHKIYVSVTIGQDRKRTKSFKRIAGDKKSPFWNEEFSFACRNYHETIQVRVWVERDTALSRMAHKLTKEGDTFIGERVMEVRRVGPPQDVWYKLGKRTTKGPEVCGHIKLSLTSVVAGDKIVTPFHVQYLKLHEQLFLHCHLNNTEPLHTATQPSGDDSVKYLPSISQEIIDEFALRYAVEPVYRMMVQIDLLVNHHSLKSALYMTDTLLKSLKFKMFMHVAADNASKQVGTTLTVLMEEYMDATNFGRDDFSRLLDKLMTTLKLDLQQYREFYPPNDKQKLQELVETCQLMDTVLQFQKQAMGIASTAKLEDLILENMKECVKSTFDYIVQNSIPESCDSELHPALVTTGHPFHFFYSILKQIKTVINEDRKVYAPRIQEFCSFNLGHVSAGELWRWFSGIIDGLFDNPAHLTIFQPKEYISLFFIVQGVYKSDIKQVPQYADVTPDYHRWFQPCVTLWLENFQKEGMDFVDNAWEDDKHSFHFGPHENEKFSSSTYQLFFYLYQGLEFIQSLGQEDQYVYSTHIESFAEVIISMVQHYIDKVASHIPQYVQQLEIACMLLNNLHSLRVNVQNLFNEMGGEQSGPITLQGFQSGILSKEHSSWCVFVGKSLTPQILKEVGTLQSELIKLKGQGDIMRDQVKDFIVISLLDMLKEKFSILYQTCEQSIMQKVMKEVWYICMDSLHRMLLPMLRWEQQSGVQNDSITQFPKNHYTGRQCGALDIAMDILKAFFTAGGSQGVKQSTIDKGIKQIKGVIGLYRETTEMLIKDFIVEETTDTQGGAVGERFCGEVFVEVDAYSHQTTGELCGHIRVMSATNLAMKGVSSQALKPYIELHLVTPSISSNRRTFSTRSKSGNSPNFNENFEFSLANWEHSELQITAKNHSILGKDKLIGIAVIQFVSIIKQASYSLTLGLLPRLPLTDRGQAILNVLSVRTFDNFAREFMALKDFHQRPLSMDGLDSD